MKRTLLVLLVSFIFNCDISFAIPVNYDEVLHGDLPSLGDYDIANAFLLDDGVNSFKGTLNNTPSGYPGPSFHDMDVIGFEVPPDMSVTQVALTHEWEGYQSVFWGMQPYTGEPTWNHNFTQHTGTWVHGEIFQGNLFEKGSRSLVPWYFRNTVIGVGGYGYPTGYQSPLLMDWQLDVKVQNRSTVPEPATMLLFCAGAACLGGLRKKFKKV